MYVLLPSAIMILYPKNGLFMSRPSNEVHKWHWRGVGPAWPKPIRKSTEDYSVSLSNSRHSVIKRMRCGVGVGLIGKIAKDLPKVGWAIDYVAAAPSAP